MPDRGDELSSLLPLRMSSFYILLALAERDQHGYGIAKDVQAATGGIVRLAPGNLYRLLKPMVLDGWIVETDQVDAEDSRRRYYRLTRHGRRIAKAEAERLTGLVHLARTRLVMQSFAEGR
jgi:DNA-binding PadR family transcriptional regulator